MRVLAVDWSGKEVRPHEAIWLADVRDGELVDLWNGRSREELIEFLVSAKGDGDDLAIGLDFAFSFPAWWCRKQGWSSVQDVWMTMEERGDDVLEACAAPFWGRPGKKNPQPGKQSQFRITDIAGETPAKSVFQIGGAGAVGTGSIRGMPHLRTLADSRFGIWPFSSTWPRVFEIYPRALTGRIRMNRWHERHTYLKRQFPEQQAELLERAAGSEDSFDAAVSALVMSRHQDRLVGRLPELSSDEAVEGRIWRPDAP